MERKKFRAMVAVCQHRPMGCGHVGWGYELQNGQWVIGAVEGANWQNIFNGYWTLKVASLEEAIYIWSSMYKLQAEYDKVKLITVRHNVTANFDFAEEVSGWIKTLKYSVINRNCMDSTYDVIRAYAPGYQYGMLPKPEDNWLPNTWYKNIKTDEEIILKKENYLPENILKSILYRSAFLGDTSQRFLIPAWRQVGNKYYFPERNGIEYKDRI